MTSGISTWISRLREGLHGVRARSALAQQALPGLALGEVGDREDEGGCEVEGAGEGQDLEHLSTRVQFRLFSANRIKLERGAAGIRITLVYSKRRLYFRCLDTIITLPCIHDDYYLCIYPAQTSVALNEAPSLLEQVDQCC